MEYMSEKKDANTDSQQSELDRLQARIYAAKMAYFHRTPFENKDEVSYEDLKSIAQDYIRANYTYQKSKYGEIRVRISVAKLLRR